MEIGKYDASKSGIFPAFNAISAIYMMRCRFSNVFPIFLLMLVLVSCRREENFMTVSAHLPLLHSELRMDNLFPGVGTDTAGALILSMEKTVYRLNVEEFWRFPDTSFKSTASLKTISLGTRSVDYRVTLGAIARSMGPSGQIILLAHGQNIVVPPFSDVSGDPLEVDITQMFDQATFVSGKLHMRVFNGLPIDLQNVVFSLRNKNLGTTVIHDTIPYLAKNTAFVDSYDLAGKTIEGRLLFELISMSSPGSGGSVLIDTNDAVTLTIQGRNMYVEEATAVFPSQNLVDDSLDVYYHLEPLRLAYTELKGGTLEVEAIHTVPDSMYFYLSLPGVTDGTGRTMDIDWVLRPSPTHDSVRRYENFSLDGYTIDLTGKNHDTFNSFYQITVLHFDSTGKKIHLSLQDSIYFNYKLLSMQPRYGRGYLGKDTHAVNVTAEMPWVRNLFSSGAVRFDALEGAIVLENTFGFDADVVVQGISGYNSYTRKYQVLTAPLLGRRYHLPAATDHPLTASRLEIPLSSSSSNLIDFLANMPDRVELTGTVFRNPSGDPQRLTDFFYDSSTLAVKIRMDAPLRLSVADMHLTDTLPFSPIGMEGPDSVRLFWKYENDYPVSWRVQVYAYDSTTGAVVDSLFGAAVTVRAAPLRDVTAPSPLGRVFGTAKEQFVLTFTPQRVSHLNRATHWVIHAVGATVPAGKKVILYSDYGLRVTVYGQVFQKMPF